MRLSILAAILLGCSAPLAPVPTAVAVTGGQILDPGCAGSPYATIQAAIDAAVDGDVVSVCSGTYVETLLVDGKQLTLQSGQGARVDASLLGTALTITGGAHVTVRGMTFENGLTAGTGGNISCSQSTLDLSNSTLEAGSAWEGGGLGAVDCTGTISNTSFVANNADTGGGAWIQGDALRITGSTFTDNLAGDDGGGLYLSGSSPVRDTVFLRNESGHQGGGGYVDHGSGDVVGNVFARNVSGDDGGGMYLYYGAPHFEANTLVANVALGDGGGVRFKLSEATIVDNEVVSNRAASRGGGVQITHDEVVMTGNAIRGNRSGSAGGGLFTRESASLFADNILERNRSAKGGGMVVWEGWGSVDIQDCTFLDNTATDYGGHLFVALQGYRTRLRRVEMSGGEAFEGGAIWADSSEVVLENTLVQDSFATSSGGGLFLDATSGQIVNSVLTGGDALDGSAVAVKNGSSFDIVNTAIVDHTGGAALHLRSGAAPAVSYSD